MRKRRSVTGEDAMGMFGLLLILLVAKLATPAAGVQETRADMMRGFLARRAIDAIAIIGWTVDRVSGVRVQRMRQTAIAVNPRCLTR